MSGSNDRGFSFSDVYQEVFPLLVRVVYRITGDSEAAEEICQEAFIRYYERMNTIPDIPQAKYWLIRVGKNLALNHEKRKGRERRAYQRAYHEPKKNPETGEESLLKAESQDTVQKALEQLPEKMRTVLVLKEYGDLNYREIASVLGISEGNVKVRVFRARERLLQLLQGGDVYVP